MNIRLVAAGTVALMLGACSSYEGKLAALDKEMGTSTFPAVAYNTAAAPQDIAPAAGQSSMSLSQYLARNYYDLAKYENDKAYDYKAARTFTEKAMSASKGQATQPSKLSTYDVPEEMTADLQNARANLMAALKDKNTPENAQSLAKAQTSFDCWLDRAEEATKDSHYETCKNDFEAAMAAVVTPAAGTPSYDIGFAQNSAAIDDAQVNTIKLVASFLNDPANAAYRANLVGYSAANTSGEFSMTLMTARVQSVRDALINAGVDVARLSPMMSPSVSQGPGKVEIMVLNDPAAMTQPPAVATPVPAPVQQPAASFMGITPSTQMKTN